MDIDCDEPAEVFTSSSPTARKPHKCCECRREIAVGEKYSLDAGRWGGDWQKFRTCGDCLSIRKVFFCGGFEYETVLEHVGEHINNANGEVSSDWIVQLTPRAADMIFNMIEDVWRGISENE
jgi:hypothetical protein